MTKIPQVAIGSIGGSGTWGWRFPEDFDLPGVRLVEKLGSFETPYGPTANLKLMEVAGEPVLRTTMHGWHANRKVPTWVCSKQIAHVFMEAGVKWALVDGSVGGVANPCDPSKPLGPWSVTATHDFIQHWVPVDDTPPFTAPSDRRYPRMRDGLCTSLRQVLYEAACDEPRFEAFDSGVYVCTPVHRFETPAEIDMIRRWGGHVVGQTLGHEVPLMRQLGIHLGSLNIVSNYAEGHVEWIGDHPAAMADFYHECPKYVGPVLIRAMERVIRQGWPEGCTCNTHKLEGMEVFPVDEV